MPDAYNLYFTPDGNSAIVVAEALKRLEFRDPQTMALQTNLATPQCSGVNHADFSIDGSYAIFTCEFAGGGLAKIDMVQTRSLGYLKLTKQGLPGMPGMNMTGNSMPQDIRIAPDGKLFYVADMDADGVYVIDGDSFTQIAFIPIHANGATAQCADLLLQGLGRVRARDVIDDDIRALPCQFQNNGHSDSTISARNDRDFSFQTHKFLLLPMKLICQLYF